MTSTNDLQPMEELYRQGRKPILHGGLIVLVILLVAVAFFIRPSSDSVILRYNVFFGVDILGTWWQAYLVPGMSLIFFLGNLFLAEILARRQAFLAAVILSYGAALAIVSGLVATATLIFINT